MNDVPNNRQAIQNEIDALYIRYPVGSEGRKHPAVQARVQSLFARLAGDGPIVGSDGRTA